MRFSYHPSMCDPSFYLELGKAAEAAGFDAITFPDSICYPKECDSTYPYNDDGSREFLDGVPFLEPFSIIPAIAAGCTMVLKPSEIAPLSSMILAEMIDEIKLPKGVFNLVNGDGAVTGDALTSHPDVNMVSFTGSTRAGALISKNAAKDFKRVSLELGGKGANIIFKDADAEAGIEQKMADVVIILPALVRLLALQVFSGSAEQFLYPHSGHVGVGVGQND